MQEIKYDGTRGKKQEGSIEDLLAMAKESLKKEDVAGVILFKGEEVKMDLSSELRAFIRKSVNEERMLQPEIEEKIRAIARDELKLILKRSDPLFQKIMKEISGSQKGRNRK